MEEVREAELADFLVQEQLVSLLRERMQELCGDDSPMDQTAIAGGRLFDLPGFGDLIANALNDFQRGMEMDMGGLTIPSGVAFTVTP